MKTLLVSTFIALSTVASATDFNVLTFGAKGDGKTDNTTAIQKTVDACAASGGGLVVFPAGNFLSGTIQLKSHVVLHLSAGCQLTGTTVLAKYPYQQHGFRFYGAEWARQSLIYAHKVDDVGIEGYGTIDGQGASFVTTTLKKPDRYRNRPYLLWFIECKKVRVSGITLRNSAFWMQHYLGCEDVSINGISIWNHSNKNNDMIDIDGSRNVTIQNVKGDSDDDGLTLKSTSPLITENVTVMNCVLSSHCNALKLGTESTGGFRNVAITNCVIRPSAQKTTIYGKPAGISGIALEMVDGGVMENISISNIVVEGPEVPIFIRLGNRARKYDEQASTPGTGRVRNIRLSGITATGSGQTGCSITGIETAKLHEISLNDISIDVLGGGAASDMMKSVPRLDDQYPEGTMFGTLPAYGFYLAHIENIQLSNVRFTCLAPDNRPALALDDVRDFALDRITMPTTATAGAVVYVTGDSRGLIRHSTATGSAKSFVAKSGANTQVKLVENDHPQIRITETSVQ
ncbi:glycoside hydrolase family 28 protein [Spirosoma aerolatum]|uniref:glycoside hydrolase family 28 protein n=1 Tax=Spirosoma aerolatum TaxID=1211326 RepID=UPI0009AE5646|nr:glycosyl hydrolase family 28 protein [Spirosoma aerolatum]